MNGDLKGHEQKTGRFTVVHSYKGGTGKSTIAVNLANYLANEQGKRVLFIEADTQAPTLERVFNVTPEYYWKDFFDGKNITDLIYPGNESFGFDLILSKYENVLDRIKRAKDSNKTVSPKKSIRDLQRLQMQKKWLNNYDHVILDTSPGYYHTLVNLISISNDLIIVSTPDVDALSTIIDMYKLFYKYIEEWKKRIIFVQNKVPGPVQGLEQLEADLYVEKALNGWENFIRSKKIELVIIPLDLGVAYYLSRKRKVELGDPFLSPFMTGIEKIVSLLTE
ncbi:MAG: MinD/ParA family protein [Candidatus Odinarchaeota archaeon]